MNQKENFYAMLEGKAEFSPLYTTAYKFAVTLPGIIEKPAGRKPGTDMFGAKWNFSHGAFVPAAGQHLFEEIEDWEKYVTFPDLDSIDFKAIAEAEMKDTDRDSLVVNIMWGTGLFDRIVALMGHENALISLVSDPESCHDFFEAMTDFKIKCIDLMVDLYRPDMITYCDDMAASQSLFMSPETYRSVIKPHHERILKAIREKDVFCTQHICGKCDELIDDFYDMGMQMWSSTQSMNNIVAVQKKYGSKLLIEGGYDSLGRPGCVDATVEEVLAEAQRCLDTYVEYGNFILIPFLMNEQGWAGYFPDSRLDAITEFWEKNARL